jgi:phage repressor protein C with HTH and peptisase S24 domain
VQRVILQNSILLNEVGRLLNEGERIIICVKGNSMLPFITGGRDSVELYKEQSYRKGDIVLARMMDERYVLHRIVRLSSDDILLMGDGSLREMEKCKLKDIAGKVSRVIRNGESIDCTCYVERVKARLWMMMLPLRRCLLALYKRVRRIQ